MLEKTYEEKAQKAQKGSRKDRKDAILWALTCLRYCGGSGLSGKPSPGLVKELFRQQSGNWAMLATQHINNAHNVCKDFFFTLLKEQAQPEEVAKRLQRRVIDALKEQQDRWNKELEKFIRSKNQLPRSNNPEYISEVEALRSKRTVKVSEYLPDTPRPAFHEYDTPQTRNTSATTISDIKDDQKICYLRPGAGSDYFTAMNALDSHWAYYKIMLKWFVETVN